MSAAAQEPGMAGANPLSDSTSAQAWRRLWRDHVGRSAGLVVLAWLVVVFACSAGGLAGDWSVQAAVGFAPPDLLGGAADAAAREEDAATASGTPVEMYGVVDALAPELAALQARMAHQAAPALRRFSLALGADKWGRSVALKTLKGAQTSVLVGLAAAALATLIGTLLGALAGYLGGTVDALLDWIYGVFNAVPWLLLVFAIAAVLHRQGMLNLILILGLTGWTGTFRLIRAEYLRHKVRDYVQAAHALGASPACRMFRHILPNVSHVVLVQLSQHVVTFIKAEVILSFLGLGVPVDVVSWGSMLSEAPGELVLGKWWQLAAAGSAMAVLVTAFALFTDALRDAFDPRLQ